MTDKRTEKYLARSRGQTVNYMPEDVVLVVDKDSPFYDERVHDPIEPEMVDDVYELGVHTPPIVKMAVNSKGKEFVGVVAGRRRFKAAGLANKRRVDNGLPPLVVECKLRNDLTDDEVRAIIVSENEQRRADSLKNKIAKATRMYKAAEEAAKAEDERFDAKATCARIAVNFGVTATTIKRWVQVPQLAAAARAAIYKGDCPIGQVDDLAKMSATNQAEAVAKVKESGATGTRGARAAAASVPRAEPPKQARRPRSAIEAKIAALEPGGAMIGGDPAERRGIRNALKWVLGEETL